MLDLSQKLELAQKWCAQHDVLIFKGYVEDSVAEVRWTDQDDLEGFLSIALAHQVRCLMIFSSVFELETETFDELTELEDEIKAKAETLFSELEKRDGELELVIISWIASQVTYRFLIRAEWFGIYHEFTELLKVKEKSSFGATVLSSEEHQNLVKKLASHENYFLFRFRREKLDVIFAEVFEKKNIDKELNFIERNKVFQEAQAYFEKHFLESKEAELTNQIKLFKEEGMTKVEMRSRLGIGESMLNKYYYK